MDTVTQGATAEAACSMFARLMKADPGMPDYAIRLSNAELRLSIDYMLYNTKDADSSAIEILTRARQRLVDLSVEAPGLKKRIVDNLASINANLETLRRQRPDS